MAHSLQDSLLDAAAAFGDDDLWAHCFATDRELAVVDVAAALDDPAELTRLRVADATEVLARWSETGRSELLADVASSSPRVSVRVAAEKLLANPRNRPTLGATWGVAASSAEILDVLASMKPGVGHDRYPGALSGRLRDLAQPAEVLAELVATIFGGTDRRFSTLDLALVCTPDATAPPQKGVAALTQAIHRLPLPVTRALVERVRSEVWFPALVVALTTPNRRLPMPRSAHGFTYDDYAAAARLVATAGPQVWFSVRPGSGDLQRHMALDMASALASAALAGGAPALGGRSAAALLGVTDPAAAPDGCLRALVDVLGAHRRSGDIAEVLCAATGGGANVRDVGDVPWGLVPASVPFAVAAAVAAGHLSETNEKGFVAAILGTPTFDWDTAEVLEVLEEHPILALRVAFGVLNARERRSTRTTSADEHLVEFSMRRCGLGAWVTADQPTAAAVALELAGHGPDVATVALGLLQRDFPGTPAELVAVASATVAAHS